MPDLNTTLSDETSLPELHQSELDQATFEQFLLDVESCTELLEVIPKYAAQSYAPESKTLGLRDAAEQLIAGNLRGMQVRYNYQGSQWWDTLMKTPSGVRLVRIQHQF